MGEGGVLFSCSTCDVEFSRITHNFVKKFNHCTNPGERDLKKLKSNLTEDASTYVTAFLADWCVKFSYIPIYPPSCGLILSPGS